MEQSPDSFRVTLLTKAFLIVLLVLWPIGSSLMMSGDMDTRIKELVSPVVQIYLPTIILQSVILLLVLLMNRHESGSARSLGYDKFTLDKLFLGLAFFVAAGLILNLLALLLQQIGSHEDFIDPSYLLPSTMTGKLVWVVLSLVVAFAEETAFRGYALTRVENIFRSRYAAAVVVSFGFAVGHFYQGIGGVAVIFVYGLMFAALFYKTGSIWPGIVAHFAQDVLPLAAAGFFPER